MAGKLKKKPFYETSCNVHGRPINEDDAKLKIYRVKVNLPEHKRAMTSGCPQCRRAEAAALQASKYNK